MNIESKSSNSDENDSIGLENSDLKPINMKMNIIKNPYRKKNSPVKKVSVDLENFNNIEQK